MFIVSRALSTSSSESLSLSLALKLSTRSLLGDSGGKLASSFELGGSSLSLETLSTPLQIHCCYFSHFPVAVEFAMKWMVVGRLFLAKTASSVVKRYLQSLSET